MTDDWQTRVDAVWADYPNMSDDELIARIDALAAERDPGDALALAERGGARDSTGREEEAVPFYRAALAAGLDDARRSQVVIQYASTVRNLGRPEESLELLSAEFAGQPDHPLADAATAFAALALASAGRPTEGLVAVLHVLAPHLPRFQRALNAYADELLEGGRE
ncbi:MAG TPA: tetratricopeptide repeat protein [Pseudolysinimonas sp.]|jgi:tetratricopeptide (TPR) repeat protein